MTDPPHPGPWLQPRSPGGAPVLAVGAMNFGKRTPEPEAARIVARAIERGITFFDTANVYVEGESERILGRAIRALPAGRDRCLVATKVGLLGVPRQREGLSAAVVEKAIDASLARLGMDHVDVYYLHAPDPTVPVEETLDGMKKVLDAGKARAWGVSNYASWQILEMMRMADDREMPRPVVSQVLYNVLVRQIEIEYMHFAAKHRLHTTVYNPLAGGLLSGRHVKDKVEPGSRFDKNRLYQRRYWSDRFFEQAALLDALAREEGTSLVELSYAWVASRLGVDSILVGPGELAHLDAAIDGCARTLSAAALTKIEELSYAFAGTDARYAR